MAGDSAVKRGAYSTKLRSLQDNGCPSVAHSHTVSTQLYQTPLSFLPPLICSVLFFLFLSLSLSRPPFFSLITEGRRIMKGRLTQAALGPVVEKRSSLSLFCSSQWAPSHRPTRSLLPPLLFFFSRGAGGGQGRIVGQEVGLFGNTLTSLTAVLCRTVDCIVRYCARM